MPYCGPTVDDEDLGDDGGVHVPIQSDRDDSSHDLPDSLKDVNRAGYDALHNLDADDSPSTSEHEHENENLLEHTTTLSSPETTTTATIKAPSTFSPSPSPSRDLTPSIPSPSPPLHIRILTNYDPIAARFYTDTRIHHTGIPRPLSTIPDHHHQHIQHIHLTIATPFRVLITITLLIDAHACVHLTSWSVEHSPPLPRLEFSTGFLHWWFQVVVPWVQGFQGERGEGGRLDWADVQVLARVFRREPDAWGKFVDEVEEEEEEEHRYSYARRKKEKSWRSYSGGYMNEGVRFRNWE